MHLVFQLFIEISSKKVYFLQHKEVIKNVQSKKTEIA
jgi:hypothetical protein